MLRSTLTIFPILIAISAVASEQPATLADCAVIVDNRRRLDCYDRLAARSIEQSDGTTAQQPVPAPAMAENRADDTDTSILDQHWELSRENKRGLFAFRPHKENYVLLANYSSGINKAPFSPLFGVAPGLRDLSHTEIKFQLGFKMKLLEDISDRHADLWFGYTQLSYWQAYNRHASRPFRETNYQPELMVVVPADFRFLGMDVRLVNLGIVHESNGQALTLSRSWNRIYAQAGMERANFTLLARAWKRLGNGNSDDDNPDITDYMGYGDVTGTYRWRGHEFSVLARRNFHTDRGGTQFGWAFPLSAGVKGYVQAFSGYGQSLIDYDFFQRAIGLGVLITY